jgi:hypothetical protein
MAVDRYGMKPPTVRFGDCAQGADTGEGKAGAGVTHATRSGSTRLCWCRLMSCTALNGCWC